MGTFHTQKLLSALPPCDAVQTQRVTWLLSYLCIPGLYAYILGGSTGANQLKISVAHTDGQLNTC